MMTANSNFLPHSTPDAVPDNLSDKIRRLLKYARNMLNARNRTTLQDLSTKSLRDIGLDRHQTRDMSARSRITGDLTSKPTRTRRAS